MTASRESYYPLKKRWAGTHEYFPGQTVSGLTTDTSEPFTATILDPGEGFTVVFERSTEQKIVRPGDEPLEYKIQVKGRKNLMIEFRLEPT